mmetsp:Transcript_105036/g.295803  ORF Transcript_105036/g.295803 Transcript_105036/m.295803 type:complete len:494 (+) Transcript_105036:70-1551(+)
MVRAFRLCFVALFQTGRALSLRSATVPPVASDLVAGVSLVQLRASATHRALHKVPTSFDERAGNSTGLGRAWSSDTSNDNPSCYPFCRTIMGRSPQTGTFVPMDYPIPAELVHNHQCKGPPPKALFVTRGPHWVDTKVPWKTWECPKEYCTTCSTCQAFVDVRCPHPYPTAYYHRVYDCMMPKIANILSAAKKGACIVGDYSSFGDFVTALLPTEFAKGQVKWVDQFSMRGGPCDELGPDPMSCDGVWLQDVGFSDVRHRTHPNEECEPTEPLLGEGGDEVLAAQERKVGLDLISHLKDMNLQLPRGVSKPGYVVVVARSPSDGRAFSDDAAVLHAIERTSGKEVFRFGEPYPTVADQLRLWAFADVIVGFHGAATANVVFSTQPAITVYELSTSWEDDAGPCFWKSNSGPSRYGGPIAWITVYLDLEGHLEANGKTLHDFRKAAAGGYHVLTQWLMRQPYNGVPIEVVEGVGSDIAAGGHEPGVYELQWNSS